jgi:Protein of unknown function (DUF3667)
MKKKNLCKNCNHHFDGNYCNQCGQSANTHRLNLPFVWHDLIHSVFHFDKGIFFTIKQLITRPGHSIREFIEGKRVNHFKPFSFVIVLATIYGFLFHYLIYDVKSIKKADNALSIIENTANWTISHFSFAVMLFIITTTISSYFVFKKQGYNVVEHLVLNTYLRGLSLLFAIIMLPLLYFMARNFGSDTSTVYGIVFQIVDFASMYWLYSQFFNKLTKTFGLTTLTYLLMLSTNLIFGYIAGYIVSIMN